MAAGGFTEMRARLRTAAGERLRAIAAASPVRNSIARLRALGAAAAEQIGPRVGPAYSKAHTWYAKREPRERLLLRLLTGFLAILMLYELVYVPFSGVGGDIADRVADRQQELIDVRAQMRSYERLKLELAATERRTVSGKDFSLFSIIEQALTHTIGRDRIGSITPSDRPVPGGFEQYTVDLKLTALSLAQIVDTLYGVQTLPMPVTVSNLHIRQTSPGSRAYDVDMTCMALARNE
jgi:hypothetical protein